MTYQLIPVDAPSIPPIPLHRPVLLIGRHPECAKASLRLLQRRQVLHQVHQILRRHLLLQILRHDRQLHRPGRIVDTIDVPWGEDVAPDTVEAALKSNDYHALVYVHNESSTGAVGNLEAVGRLVRHRDTLLITDTVSGLGGVEMLQDQWGVDIAVSASQKCLMCPPGIEF